MRAFVALPALLLAASAAKAQDFEALLKEKLSKPFASHVAWVHDYEEALGKAKATDGVVFAYFTRSYAP